MKSVMQIIVSLYDLCAPRSYDLDLSCYFALCSFSLHLWSPFDLVWSCLVFSFLVWAYKYSNQLFSSWNVFITTNRLVSLFSLQSVQLVSEDQSLILIYLIIQTSSLTESCFETLYQIFIDEFCSSNPSSLLCGDLIRFFMVKSFYTVYFFI